MLIGDWELLANLLGILIFIVVDYNQSIANNTTYNYNLTKMYIYIYSFYNKNNRHVLISQIINSTYNSDLFLQADGLLLLLLLLGAACAGASPTCEIRRTSVERK